MTDSSDRLVLVAGELHDLSGPGPEWPGGRETLFHQPGLPLPARTDVDAIIPLVSQRVGEAELAGLPSLRVVANYGVGYDNIDLAAAARRGIVVTNTPDVLTDATADLALARIGRIGKGCRADLVILDGQGQVVATIRSGRRVGAAPDQPFLPDGTSRVD